MKHMSKAQVEDHIYDRCVAWWVMYNDCDEDGVKGYRKQIEGLIKYFKAVNDEYVQGKNLELWVQLEVMLSDCEVALDMEVWDSLDTHASVVEELLGKIRIYLI